MIIVCGLHDAQAQIDLHKAGSVIGILGPESTHPTYKGVAEKDHLKLAFSDINEETSGLIAPSASDAEKLIAFVQNWNRRKPMLIHCWAGISRSTASAYATMCLLRPDEDEFKLAKELRHASPSATPNRLITRNVDLLLKRQGRMLNAIESIGRGEDAYAGKPFTLKVGS